MAGQTNNKILFYVQHLLGVGHVFRVKRLCEGFTAAGLQVDVIFGGQPLPDMDFGAANVHMLPPIKAGAIDYSFNVDGNGNALGKEYMARRQKILLDIFVGLAPDIIIIEAWPFGRRVVRHEIIAMLEVAKKRPDPPLVVCSVRDILQENRKAGRIDEVVELIDRHIDHVLVHSDPALIKLDVTFPRARDFRHKTHYTGFVRAAPQISSPDFEPASKPFEVIVSAGGGAFGGGLLIAALDARKLSSLKDARWCLSTGPNMPQDVVDLLHSRRPKGVEIVAFLPDFGQQLKMATLSISQVGYNTAMDVLAAGEDGNCKSVFVPSDIAGQSEQLRRAELLHQARLAICLPESQLDAKSLATAIDRALDLPAANFNIDFSGVEKSTRFILDMLASKRGNR